MAKAGVQVEWSFDLLADKVFPPAGAVRVGMRQRAHPVARASGDLAGCSSGRSARTARQHAAGRNVFIAIP
jgi:hypothetical protein